MADLTTRARNVPDGGWAQAARLYEQAYFAGEDPDVDDATAFDSDNALVVLEQRFPDVAQALRDDYNYNADAYTAERNGRGKRPLSGGVKKTSGGGKRSNTGAGRRGGTAAGGSRRSSTARSRRDGSRRRSSRATSLGAGYLLGRRSAAVEATGLPGTTRGITSVVLYGLGAIVGLSIVYDLLAAAEHGGPRSPGALFIKGVEGFLERLVSPLADPLAPVAGSRPAPAPKGNPAAAAGVPVIGPLLVPQGPRRRGPVNTSVGR
jgi:hypothetical protein